MTDVDWLRRSKIVAKVKYLEQTCDNEPCFAALLRSHDGLTQQITGKVAVEQNQVKGARFKFDRCQISGLKEDDTDHH